MLGLVLTAGGARGAYQVGVMKRVAEIPALRERPLPFQVIAGASAGALNGAALAARAEMFRETSQDLARLWSELRVEQVFRTDLGALAGLGASLGHDLALGGLLGQTVTHGLFDTTPLERLLAEVFPPDGIAAGLQSGHLYAVAVAATSYHSGRSYTFIQGKPGHPTWQKSRRVGLPAVITHRHILASAAIPIVFPPVLVSSEAGELWFGDGGLRLVAPMSPAIRLGARHVFAVGIRSSRAADVLANEEAGGAAPSADGGPRLPCPPLAQVCGVFMNAIFLDHLDADLEHLRRMNDLLDSQGAVRGKSWDMDAETRVPHEPMRRVEALVISPTEDMALIAQRFAHRMPRIVRYVLEGLGTPDAQSADLLSYLLFDASYTRTLVDLGYRDAADRIDEIESFLEGAGAFADRRPPSLLTKARRQRPVAP